MGARSAGGNGDRRRPEARRRPVASALRYPPQPHPAERKNALAGVSIALFGRFELDESRSRIIAKALRRAGASVAQVTDPRRFALRTPALLSRVVPQTVDMLLVGRAGHADVASAKAVAVAKRIPVVFDPFVSLHEAWTDNRPESASLGLRARRYLAEDELSCRLADLVLLDTQAHIEYFVRRIGVSSSKLERIWLGADDEVMYPRPQVRQGPFRLLYHGGFGRLDGVEHVVRAVALLQRAGEDVEVVLLGHGGTRRAIRELADELDVGSIRFLGPRSDDDLAVAIAESDACLGLFGTSPRGTRVLPSRVFDALACARPVITADTPAAREVLVHKEHAWLCGAGDPASLADAINGLKHDRDLRISMAEAGYARFKQGLSLDALAADLSRVLLPLLHPRPTSSEPSRSG